MIYDLRSVRGQGIRYGAAVLPGARESEGKHVRSLLRRATEEARDHPSPRLTARAAYYEGVLEGLGFAGADRFSEGDPSAGGAPPRAGLALVVGGGVVTALILTTALLLGREKRDGKEGRAG